MNISKKEKIIDFWEKGYLYIFIAGLIYFIWFISGRVGVLDWFKEIAYFEYFKTSFNDFHMLPYFWWNILEDIAWRPPIPGTSAIISNPETAFFSPLTPLLYFMSAKIYIRIYIVLQFIVGVYGLIALRKKLKWDNAQFRTFAALFLFGPIIMQHLAVAYFTWYNFYLFPWFIYFIADRRTSVAIVGSSAVLGLIVLQGGIYIVQYFGLFYVVYEILHIILEKDWKRVWRLFLIPILSILLSFARIYLTSYAYGDYVRPWVEIDGYNLPFFLFYAIIPTITIPPLNLVFHSDFMGWFLTPHDSGLFWGLSIVMLLFVIVNYKKIVIKPESEKNGGINYNAIFIAASFLFVISFFKTWYYIMKVTSILDMPLFESIKNHGIRFIMGSYYGFALLLANYSKEIWNKFHSFIKTRFWNISKSVLGVSFKIILFITGLVTFSLKLFKATLHKNFDEVITAAYNNSGYFWLRERMEGMEEKSIDFYYSRFDMVYNSFHFWITIIFSVVLIGYIITITIRKNHNSIEPIIARFPNLKFELLLVIPLIFSTAMWANLAASVPYDSYDVLPVVPPELIVESSEFHETPNLSVTPKSIIISPNNDSVPNGYLFPQINSADSKHFIVISNNADLSDKNGKMFIEPLDNNPIEIHFKIKYVWNSIVITLIMWVGIICFVIVKYFSRKNINIIGQD